MESGTPGLKATDSGWMNRALAKPAGQAFAGARRGAGAGAAAHLARQRSRPWRCRASPASRCATPQAAAASSSRCTRRRKDPVLQAAPAARRSKPWRCCKAIQKQPYTPAAGADYPRGRFGESLQQIAQLIKADVGMEMAFADIGGWDHHVNEVGQRASEGQLANLLRELRPGAGRLLDGHGRPHGATWRW